MCLAAVLLALGAEHTCATLQSAAAWCWGASYVDEAGNEAYRATLPAQVPFTERVTSISAGGYHTCAIPAKGRLFCWGGNWSGELGNGSTRPSPVPVEVAAPRP